MKISVVIPCYRNSSTLERAITSLLAQTYKVHEIIVVNDASPETEEIDCVIEKYASIIYIKNPINIGPAGSRNIGILAATGSVIAFLDADDEYHPQKLEIQIQLYKLDVAVTTAVLRLDMNQAYTPVSYDIENIPFNEFHDPRHIIYANKLTGAALLVSKSILINIGLYDQSLRSCEDYDLWLRLLQKGIPVFDVSIPLYIYRFNKFGLSKDLLQISQGEARVIDKYIGRNHQKLAFKTKFFINFFWFLRRLYRRILSTR